MILLCFPRSFSLGHEKLRQHSKKRLRVGKATLSLNHIDTVLDRFDNNIVEHNRKIPACKPLRNGGDTRDRTDDLIVANDVVLRDSALIPQGLRAKHPLRTAIYWNTIGTQTGVRQHPKEVKCRQSR